MQKFYSFGGLYSNNRSSISAQYISVVLHLSLAIWYLFLF